MNFEPQKVFIRLIDFFSIIVPGALRTYPVGNEVDTGLGIERAKRTEGRIVFLAGGKAR